ncbi:restriction endonuclease subunit S [Bibersteinia trehalosi]|uniref:Restriction endonuclease subunit S n=1 Tax=Bibersteinia trehalosi TaxID=47735 RepID=A0A426FIC9_BIBTR|nr:restriction endonuclease subunit S [Bibersteinia trehalosi]RRN03837.1 restriction endonuclease subunit S [Bibersteinia trehalosi]
MAFDITKLDFILPNNWELVRLGDIADINSNTISKKDKFKTIKYIDISSVSTHSMELPKEILFDQSPSRARRKLKNNDFIISTVRPNLRQFVFLETVEPNWIASTGFCVVSAKNSKHSWYLYSLVTSETFTEYLSRVANGGAYPAFNAIEIENAIIPLPNDDDLELINSFAKNINNKIQLNTQTNQTLEAIAQAIFKSWFVDFDPVRAKAATLNEGKSEHEANLAAMSVICGKNTSELNDTEFKQLWEIAEAFPSELVKNEEFGEVPKGWENTTLSEICSMQNGYAFKSSDWRDNGIPVIKIGSIQSNIVNVFGNGFVDLEYTETKKDFVLKSGDIIIALTGAYVGKAGIMPANSLAMLNQRVAKFLPKTISNNVSYYSYIYCLSQRTELKDFISFTAQGSAQPNISTKELLAFKILLGNKELHLHFEKVCKILLDKMISNSGENENLSSIRDLLLPKLLNGEI